jgi:DNA-binding LacI/PurR family transcriptional regulator
VIGFDDILMAAWPSYNLTTIRQPVVPMMDESVEVLLRRVEDPEAPFVNRLIPGDLVVRGLARLPKGVSSGWVITKEQDHE